MTTFEEERKKAQAVWSAGDFNAISGFTVLVGELLCEAVDLRGGQRVLDVGTGSGNTALSAARRWCNVSGIDFVSSQLEIAKKRAELEELSIEFKEGSAEDISFPDETFDAVLSTFGCMFATDQNLAAKELLRVCKIGGKIGLACWTPDCFFGEFSKTSRKYFPSSPEDDEPSLWETKEGLQELFKDRISSLKVAKKSVFFRAPTIELYLERFRKNAGPVVKTYEKLDQNAQASLTKDLVELANKFNIARDGTMVVPGNYLEIVVVRNK